MSRGATENPEWKFLVELQLTTDEFTKLSELVNNIKY
jgi:hypothetical protein